MQTNNMEKGYNPTCFFTGETSKLKMHPIRNDNGDMLGWIFIHDSIDMQDGKIHWTYEILEITKRQIDSIKSAQELNRVLAEAAAQNCQP